MDKEIFDQYIKENTQIIDEICHTACKLHESVCQFYDNTLPYGYHLSKVAETAMKYGWYVINTLQDILPVIFAAYYHDSIEDARLTYNDVLRSTQKFMAKEQSMIAAEIVYALTNDKGRTRQERAGEHYYKGIRETPYAPFIKLCDRYANMRHSFKGTNSANIHMQQVYRNEWTHFIKSITVIKKDSRFCLPPDLIKEIDNLL